MPIVTMPDGTRVQFPDDMPREQIRSMIEKRFPPKFDPEGSGYDYETARKAGLGPDASGHWPSRDPKSGQILKGRGHETFNLTEEGEKKAGMRIRKGEGGRYFSEKDESGAYTFGRGAVQGAILDPVEGIGQLIERATGAKLAPDAVRKWLKEVRDETERTGTGTAGRWTGLLGSLVAAPEVLLGAKALGAFGQGVVRGGAQAAKELRAERALPSLSELSTVAKGSEKAAPAVARRTGIESRLDELAQSSGAGRAPKTFSGPPGLREMGAVSRGEAVAPRVADPLASTGPKAAEAIPKLREYAKAVGKSPFELTAAERAAAMAGELPAAAEAVAAPAARGVLPFGTRVAVGAGTAAAQPVEGDPEDYWSQKGMQALAGGSLGGLAGSALARGAGKFIKPSWHGLHLPFTGYMGYHLLGPYGAAGVGGTLATLAALAKGGGARSVPALGGMAGEAVRSLTEESQDGEASQ